MNCPKCNISLSMTDRQGVEIDFCPQCRGIWLDRGELDKIIERAGAAMVAPPPAPSSGYPPPVPPPQPQSRDYRRRDDDDDDDDDDYKYRGSGDHRHYGHGKKKKSFLGELFDF